MAGSFHELSKEPNNHQFFESMLRFIGKSTLSPFGVLDPKQFNFTLEKPRRKLWKLLTLVYFLVGILLAIIKRRKRLLLLWPGILKR